MFTETANNLSVVKTKSRAKDTNESKLRLMEQNKNICGHGKDVMTHDIKTITLIEILLYAPKQTLIISQVNIKMHC